MQYFQAISGQIRQSRKNIKNIKRNTIWKRRVTSWKSSHSIFLTTIISLVSKMLLFGLCFVFLVADSFKSRVFNRLIVESLLRLGRACFPLLFTFTPLKTNVKLLCCITSYYYTTCKAFLYAKCLQYNSYWAGGFHAGRSVSGFGGKISKLKKNTQRTPRKKEAPQKDDGQFNVISDVEAKIIK